MRGRHTNSLYRSSKLAYSKVSKRTVSVKCRAHIYESTLPEQWVKDAAAVAIGIIKKQKLSFAQSAGSALTKGNPNTIGKSGYSLFLSCLVISHVSTVINV